ncbi:FMN adenylyltransferase / Riboflavin kinase [uncultured Rubrobacteraceae bacterium]|uniref:Riboflavin biosynthesis protein n=1 Tax=uncultured Rubrobacteraceae bacterium TaxID=349277 RepID=A0A6J4P5J0_9ACTN|nr:FMN adenylyltransferase / Riboflavin kinase [uncultured Rubrobacteraceae bacterium]
MRGVVVALGNFDGVHLGHQEVLRRAVEEGRRGGMKVVAATFHPHPRAVLGAGDPPVLLTPLGLRRGVLLGYGADEVVEIPFDLELSRKSPEDFVRDVLVGEIGAGVVVVGENFRFGHRAAGDVGDLGRLMREVGGDAVAVEVRGVGGEGGISSTRIRALISEGEVAEAAALLGRPYVLRGEVVIGDRRGRTIGFPTANVLPDIAAVIPARGVYAGFVLVGDERYAACTNVGVAPTFGRAESRVEAYLLDFDGDLYGRTVDVSFTRRIRGEKKFSGIEELKAQIQRDVGAARLIAEELR